LATYHKFNETFAGLGCRAEAAFRSRLGGEELDLEDDVEETVVSPRAAGC
jgi:hypothetical protein